MRRAAPWLALALSVGACAQPAKSASSEAASSSIGGAKIEWVSPLDRDHRLAGRVWNVARGEWLPSDALVAQLVAFDFVLLGEKHDNGDHHRQQASVIRGLVDAKRRPLVALEMLEPDDEAAVARYRAGQGAKAEGLGPALAWDKTGWPPWAMYQPIAEVAFDAKLTLGAANLPRAEVRAVARDGASALSPGLYSRLGLDVPLAPALETSLEKELSDSHCGHLPEAMVPSMALAQRARDAAMADRLLLAGKEGAVLIAGADHVREDRGVPLYLRARRTGARVVSVAFVEVARGENDPRAYAARFGASVLPFDYAWFTPRANDDDPCGAFRKPVR